MPTKAPTAKEYRELWAGKLRRAQGEGSASAEALQATADFLGSFPPATIPTIVCKHFCKTRAVYLVDRTLHVHTQRIRKNDELNAILLATHFGVATEVRIHNFHTYRYFTSTSVHVRITQSYWDTVRTLLTYINQGEWIVVRGRVERSILVTFDDFLYSAVIAWKKRQPYASIVCSLPTHKVNIITTTINVPGEHPSLSVFTRGYAAESESDDEVDIESLDDEEERLQIMLFLGTPSLSIDQYVLDTVN